MIAARKVMDEMQSTRRAKKRKRYLEPGEEYAVPRTTLLYQKRRDEERQPPATVPNTFPKTGIQNHSPPTANPVIDQQSSEIATPYASVSDLREQQNCREDHEVQINDDCYRKPDEESIYAHSCSANEDNVDSCSAGEDDFSHDRCRNADQENYDSCHSADEDDVADHCNRNADEDNTHSCRSADDGDSDREFSDFFSIERLPNSDVTVRDAMFILMAYTSSSGLNWVDMEKLVGVINLFLGKPILPTSQYLLRKVWKRWEADIVKRHYFCEECGAIIPNPEKREFLCPSCNTSNSAQNFFATVSIEKQLEVMLTNDTVAQTLLTSLKKKRATASDPGSSENKVIRDITDGKLYQRQMGKAAWSDVSLTLNTDGARAFKCSKSSLWPIQAVVNELPVPLRWKHVLLCGLYFGKSHPNMASFLEVFTETVRRAVNWECDGEKYSSNMFTCCCVDAPARAAVLNIKQFNGYYGCSYCHHKGVLVNRSVKYPVADDGGHPEPWTNRSVRSDMKSSLISGEPSRGVKGFSPLARLPDFDLVWGVCPDYMHCVLEGVTRQLADTWFGCVQSASYIGVPATLSQVNTRLLSIKPPQWFSRLPRSIGERALWKASEWKWWLLFYSVPCLEGILPEEYLHHFCSLVAAVYILLKDEMTEEDIHEAMDKLSCFVLSMEELYGREAMTFNVHQLLHLPKSVLELGPLWSHSAFVFESGNGMLLKLISDANGVPLQILERFAMRLQITKLANTLNPTSQVQAVYDTLMPSSCAGKSSTEKPLGRGTLLNEMDEQVQCAVQEKLGQVLPLMKFKRIDVHGQRLHVEGYRRAKKTRNCIFRCVQGKYYILESVFQLPGSTCLLLCTCLASESYRDLPHIHKCAKTSKKVVLAADKVSSVSVAMDVGRVCYVGDMPNLFEKD
ncbi:uncharacterized protein LOC144101951 [Amblyomma americanum]